LNRLSVWQDARDLLAIPLVALCLPGRFRDRFLAFCVRATSALRENGERATRGASTAATAWPVSPDAAGVRFALLKANVETLAQFFKRRARNVATASPAEKKGQLVVSFHWGHAMQGLADMAARIGPTHFVAAPLEKAEYQHHRLRYHHARLCITLIERITGAPVLFTGGAREPILQALHAGNNVCVLVDVPPHQTTRVLSTPVFSQPLHLPNGFAALAVKAGAPVQFMARCSDGLRHRAAMFDSTLGVFSDEQALCDAVGRELERCLAHAPDAWHMWQHLPDFVSPLKENLHVA
jgi:hypothetical protein